MPVSLKRLSLALVVFCLCLPFTASGGDDDEYNTLTNSVTPGSYSAGSSITAFTDPSNTGSLSSSVNLYTGQHQESFPLVSIPGRGGLGVSLSLDYNGNVSHVMLEENRKAQASPWGLGFDLGLESIKCNHMGTADIRDDEYVFILGTAAVRMIKANPDSSRYILENGEPWVIYPSTDLVGGKTCVIGWTVIKQDGTVYKYGDFSTDYSSWNATRNVLRYGNFVGSGVTTGDIPYPFQWDLARIQDAQNLNWIKFTYIHEPGYLKVRNATGDDITDSDNAYTRYSYLKTIETADSNRIEIEYGTREDYQPFYGVNIYEFYSSKFPVRIFQKNPSGQFISYLILHYGYLNDAKGSSFKKLVLNSIEPRDITGHNGDGWFNYAWIPSCHFEYDPDYGNMTKITYPSGAVKELQYQQTTADQIVSSLDIQLSDMVPSTNAYTNVVGNIFTHRQRNGHLELGVWDGYWRIDTLMENCALDDNTAISPDGWMVYPSGNELIVRRWMGGYWDVDTLQDEISRDCNVYLYAGKDCFVAATGTYDYSGYDEIGSCRQIARGYFYRWDGSEWHGEKVLDDGEWNLGTDWNLGKVELGVDCYVISYWKQNSYDEDNSRVGYVLGKYDPISSTIKKRGPFDHAWHSLNTGSVVAMGPGDMIGALYYNYYSSVNGVWIWHWDPESGDWTWQPEKRVSDWLIPHNVFALPNGVAACVSAGDGKHYRLNTYQLDSVQRTSEFVWELWDEAEAYVGEIHGTPHSLGLKVRWYGGGGPVVVAPWNGLRFGPSILYIEGDVPPEKRLYMFGDGCALGPPVGQDGGPFNIISRRFEGNGSWATEQFTVVCDEAAKGFTATDEAILFRSQKKSFMYWYDSRQGDYTGPYTLVDYSSLPLDMFVESAEHHCQGGKGRTFAIDYHIQQGLLYPIFWSSSFCFHVQPSQTGLRWSGPPVHRVISSISLYPNEGSDATIQSFSYFGGISDPSTTTPRFARAEVSTPYFAGDAPDGYTRHYFYNDMDRGDEQFQSVFDADPNTEVDLKSAAKYGGIANGGYQLDGQEYYSYSYSTNPSDTVDWTRVFHSLAYTPDNISGVYRTRIDKSVARKDSLETEVIYNYDDYSNQVVSTRTKLAGENEYLVDSVVYAFRERMDSADLREIYNALTPVSKKLSLYEAGATDSVLAFAGDSLELIGSWIPVETYTFGHLNPFEDSVSTFKTLPDGQSFDQWGNRISSIGADGDTSCVKYNAKGNQIVATGQNCYLSDFLVQDFEQSEGWDGWYERYEYSNISLVTDDVFTGTRALKIVDDANSSANNWGPSRAISVDDLTDSVYYMSCWVKTDHDVSVYLWLNDYSKNISFTDLVPNEWQKIEAVYHITGSDLAGLDNISAELVLRDNETAIPGVSYAIFDDFRFHPLDAVVSTKTYDPVSGVVTSESGQDNFPMKYEYDAFLRPIAVYDHKDEILSHTYYKGASQFTADNPYHVRTTSYSANSQPLNSVTYYDGLGRVLQTRSENPNGASEVIVSTSEYDSHGRATKEYKPFLENYTMDLDSTAYLQVAYDPILWNDYYTNSDYGNLAFLDVDTLVYYIGTSSFDRTTGCCCEKDPEANDTLCLDGRQGRFWWELYMETNYEQEYCEILLNGNSVAYLALPNLLRAADGCEQIYLSDTGSFLIEEGDTVMIILDNSYGWCKYSTPPSSYCKSAVWIAAIDSTWTYWAVDTTTTNWVRDFDAGDVAAKVLAYYDADGPGVDCGGYPFSEYAYSKEVNSKLDSAGAPGEDWFIGSGRPVKHQQLTDVAKKEYISKTIDQDGVELMATADHWGTYERSYGVIDGDTIVTTTYKDRLGRDTAVYLDTLAGTAPIPLRRTTYNDRGMVTSTWKVDYGTIRMLYDLSGNLRFMQNDKRLAENKFVYFKYDQQGRKIEEGIMGSAALYFKEANARIESFPDTSTYDPDVQYRWYYDYYDKGDSVIVAPGKLVRVEDNGFGDYKYYREFYYYPEDYYDITLVKMPVGGHTLKAIRHDYNFDGSLKKLTVYPHWPDDTDARQINYSYDKGGNISILANPSTSTEQLLHALYYNGLNGRDSTIYGWSGWKSGGSWLSEFAQKVNYTYDPRGMLTGINSPSGVVPSLTGGGDTNDHFGLTLDYTADDNGYFNGRVKNLYASNSGDGTVIDNDYSYTYNDLGWLTDAVHQQDPARSRHYTYNRIGNRTSLVAGSDTITYDYYDSQGSSKLRWFTGMGNDTLQYDILGNLVADYSRDLFSMTYDYRNLMNEVKMSSEVYPDRQDIVRMKYDQTGQRVEKTYIRFYLGECEDDPNPPGPPNPTPDNVTELGTIELPDDLSIIVDDQVAILASSSGGGDTCILYDAYVTRYLYDNGVLVATFDENDNVIDMFVNGPEGMIATYHENDDAQLYYFLTDQIGSPRVIMHSPGGGITPQVAQYNNYHPFGQIHQSWGSFNTPYTFTGKEQDDDGDFKFHYFGARYYDARIGMFSSIDKASQFAGGYLYGGNNPILVIDPDGNFGIAWWELAKAVVQFGGTYLQSAMETGEFGKASLNAGLNAANGHLMNSGIFEADLGNIEMPTSHHVADALAVIPNSVHDYFVRPVAQGAVGFGDGAMHRGEDLIDTDIGDVYRNTFEVSLTEHAVNLARGLRTWPGETWRHMSSGPYAFGHTLGYYSPEIGLAAYSLGSASSAEIGIMPRSSSWTRSSFQGVKVYQRSDLFDPLASTTWKVGGHEIVGTNLERMSFGRAPIGIDGKPICLHHLTQTNTGAIAEVTQTFHQGYYRTIHINFGGSASGLNRTGFQLWRSEYWKHRANLY
ncbi:MAG: HNH/ENDO VII family nuclease [Candidatus Zixiibacteriota bacterium]